MDIHIPELSGEKLARLFDIPGLGPLYLTNTLLTTWITMLLLITFGILVTRRMALVPSGIQNLGEMLIEALLNFVQGAMAPAAARRVLPLIATLFIFILTANYIGLMPMIGTVGIPNPNYHHEEKGGYAKDASKAGAATKDAKKADEHKDATKTTTQPGESTQVKEAAKGSTGAKKEEKHEYPMLPLFRAPNSDLNTTMAMAIIAVLVIQFSSIAAHGFGGYIKHMTEPGGIMTIIMGPVHAFSEISRIISLSCRLFGNVLAGEILVAVMQTLAAVPLALVGIAGLGLLVPVVFLLLEMFFGFIQALIFSFLTLSAIGLVIAGSHDDHHTEGHATELHGDPSKHEVHASAGHTAG